MTKKKSKIAEFFSNVGTALAFIWMLPMFVVKGIQEHFEKKREAKQPKPEPIQFVCSECGETFEADNVKKEMRNHASSKGDYTYLNPQPCPKCGGKRTRPTESDKAFYQRLWNLEETASFISHLWINWGPNDSLVDKGKQEFKCTQCGTTFSAIDIRPHPYSASLPSRCPHCQSIRTLPASEEKQAHRYESIWLLMELAEKEREESKTEKNYVDLMRIFGGF
jgi:DNA-directed RNA polymerase subunit RPC12/RpoP